MRNWINLVKSFVFKNPDSGWVERSRANGNAFDVQHPDPRGQALKDAIQPCGGWAVGVQTDDPDLDALLRSGHPIIGPMKLVGGKVNNCHENSKEMVKSNPGLKLATGYACTDDGFWRCHSWVMDGDTILEATPVHRDYYWGIVFDTLIESHTPYEQMNQAQLAREASGYMRGMGASGHPDACHSEDEYDRRFEPNYPLKNLNPDVNKVEWMEEEIKMWADEGEPDRYYSEIHELIREPIIAIEIDGVGVIIDGWHRTGGSAMAGRTTIPAIVGVLRR